MKAAAEQKKIPVELATDQFNKGFHSKFSIAMALMVLAYGGLVHLVYRKKVHWYARSLVFGLHSFSTFFLLLLLWRLFLHYQPWNLQLRMEAFFLIVLPPILLSVRRVWPEPVFRWLPKSLLLWTGAMLAFVMAVGLGIVAQIATYGPLMRSMGD